MCVCVCLFNHDNNSYFSIQMADFFPLRPVSADLILLPVELSKSWVILMMSGYVLLLVSPLVTTSPKTRTKLPTRHSIQKKDTNGFKEINHFGIHYRFLDIKYLVVLGGEFSSLASSH
jgi:hypothetical protein